MQKSFKSLIYTAMLGIMASSASHSAGFSLYMEDNGYAVGNFGAGLAAEAADASTGWYNPAGLVLIHNQELVGGGVGVFPVGTLSGRSLFTTTTPSPLFPLLSYPQNFRDIRSAKNAFVPSVHYARPWNDRLTFGLSVVAPFGLATDWGANSPVRYEATYTDLFTANVSPQFGYRFSDNFAVGAGLDVQYAKVAFNSIIGAPTVLDLVNQDPSRVDSLSDNRGKSYGVGFHAGVLGMFNDDCTRVGLNYQSRMRHRFHGTSTLTGYLASNDSLVPGPIPSGTFSTNDLSTNPINFPDIITLSGYQRVNDRLAILGSVVYTAWSVLDVIELNHVAAVDISPTAQVTQTFMNITSPQNYSDVIRLALGANYCISPQWMLRLGGGYDETPTNNRDRDVRLPDTSRWGLSIGSHYQFRPNLGIDVGYTHIFSTEESRINRTDPLGPTSLYNVTASGKNFANLVSAQFVWQIDQVAVDDAPMKD